MTLLKNRRAAIAIFIAVVIVFTVIGINLSAARVVKSAEKQFYSGVYLKDEKYTEASINGHLEKCAEAALMLITLTSDEPELSDETAALRSARAELLSAETIGEKFVANEKLNAAYIELKDKLPDDLAASEIAKTGISRLSGAESAILRSSYNASASAANDKILSGVLTPMKLLLFTGKAELFE